ncbi:zinc-finger transcription factor of the zn -cys binuclear cluster domain involved in the [Brettanomyces bruxellensis AWRI1499]|nr:zinc-finger transcription factor of the zn -cys binuclear cluster domain involved in the [Brettanomyces bruxellensis AWRI1499]
MEKLRSISMDQTFSSEYVVLPSFWTYFLCGSDAVNIDIQRRYDSLGSWWFNSGSKWIGRQMMLEIWRGRNYGMSVDRQISENLVPSSSQIEASEETETSWLDLVKGWEMSGFH